MNSRQKAEKVTEAFTASFLEDTIYYIFIGSHIKRLLADMEYELKEFIKKCDNTIKQEDFETLKNYYTDGAILVVKPGMITRGKEEIKQAFIKIAK